MLVLYFVGIVLLTVVDQLAKWLVCQHIPYGGEITVIENIFNLRHEINTGAGLGILKGQFWLFYVVTVLVIVGVTVYMLKARHKKWGMTLALTLLVGGAMGNFLDRIFRGFVIDYLDFGGLYFPFVFNLADCFIVVGAVIFAVYIIIWERTPVEESSADSEEISEANSEGNE